MRLFVKIPIIMLTLLSTPAFATNYPETQEGLKTCLVQLSQDTLTSPSYTPFLNNIQANFKILDKLNYQPEFKLPAWDYFSALVDSERIQQGRILYQRHLKTLEKIQQTFKIDPYVLIAVWGIETNYGKNIGKLPILDSLATLSCFGRRQNYFRKELKFALDILTQQDVQLSDMKGSWAGAFGNTQFMPSTYQKLAIDFDHDGKRDLIHSIPDALASTANFLIQSGWQPNLAWGVEVNVPPNTPNHHWKDWKSIAYWQKAQVTPIQGQLNQLFPKGTVLGLFRPEGEQGPAFLVSKNFKAVYHYNASTHYALAILALADRIKGKPNFKHTWSEQGLSRKERQILQTLLNEQGYDIGQADGILGKQSRLAIEKVQKKLGLPPTGLANKALLQQLQKP